MYYLMLLVFETYSVGNIISKSMSYEFLRTLGFLDSPYLGLFFCLLLDQQLPCTEVTWCESTSIVLFCKIISLVGGSWVWWYHPHACFGGLFQPQSLNLSRCTLLHLDRWRRHCNENTLALDLHCMRGSVVRPEQKVAICCIVTFIPLMTLINTLGECGSLSECSFSCDRD